MQMINIEIQLACITLRYTSFFRSLWSDLYFHYTKYQQPEHTHSPPQL